MTRLQIILLLTLFFLSWRDFTTEEKAKKKFYNTTPAIDDKDPYNYLKNIKDVNVLIAWLNDTTDLEDKHIGFTGKYSTSYAYFERLTDIAPDSVLVQLTYHTNPKLRVYGMWALTKNNKRLALKQLQRIKKDQSIVMYFSGCITMPSPVCFLAASRFDSSEVAVVINSKKGYLHFDVKTK